MKWTPGRAKSFLTSVIRAGFRKWPPKYECLNAAKAGKRENPLTGRMAEHYKCNKCKKLFPLKEVQVDHVKPVVDPKEGFVDWNTFIDRLFCQADNLQALCRTCHALKTKEERIGRMEYSRDVGGGVEGPAQIKKVATPKPRKTTSRK